MTRMGPNPICGPSFARARNFWTIGRAWPGLQYMMSRTRNIGPPCLSYAHCEVCSFLWSYLDAIIVDVTGAIICAYGVPAYITYGPPFCGFVEMPSSAFISGTTIIMWGLWCPQWLSTVSFIA